MAVWQFSNNKEHWMSVDPSIAARWYSTGGFIRLITDPATLRDCWHCGRVMEAGPVDEKGREWCGCMQVRMQQMIADAWRRKENEGSLT